MLVTAGQKAMTPHDRSATSHTLRRHSLALLVVVLGAMMERAPAAAQITTSLNVPWNGWAQCVVDVQGPDFSNQQTHTWTIIGPPTMVGAFAEYQATWSVTGQGSLLGTSPQGSVAAQWATTAPPMTSARIGVFTRASDGRLIVVLRHAQLSVPDGVTGTQQIAVGAAAPSVQGITLGVWEWRPFPVIEDVRTATRLTGSTTMPVTGRLDRMQPAGAQGQAVCTWDFAQGGALSAAPQPRSGAVLATGATLPNPRATAASAQTAPPVGAGVRVASQGAPGQTPTPTPATPAGSAPAPAPSVPTSRPLPSPSGLGVPMQVQAQTLSWTGSARCVVSSQGPQSTDYFTDVQTHTWTLTGGAATFDGAAAVYPATWSVRGSGERIRLGQSGDTLNWIWQTSADAVAPLSVLVRPGDNRLIIVASHTPLQVPRAAFGDTYALNSSGQPIGTSGAGGFSADVTEWAFPTIEDVVTSMQVTGSSSQVVTGSGSSPLFQSVFAPAGTRTTATCSWAFERRPTLAPVTP